MDNIFDEINFSNDVFDLISTKLIKKISLIPYKQDIENLYVFKHDDDCLVNDNILKLIFNKKIIYKIISKSEFDNIVNYLDKSSLNNFYEEILEENLKTSGKLPLFEEKNEFFNSDIKNNLVVRTIDNLIEKAILSKASDIHFEPSDNIVNVRMRIDGELKKVNEYNSDLYSQITSRIKILSNLDITNHSLTQDGKFSFKYNNEYYDIRTSVLPTNHGERISLRVLDDLSNKISLDNLYLDSTSKEKLKKVLNSMNGLILVVGPTGSGKTTTLYSMLKEKIDEKINIITVEDPIEYSINGISQVQVDYNTGLTFQATLRSVLRQDPDVFMIGEIRDEESAKIAIRSAITGHLVFSTLHANDAISTISRLKDMGIPPFMIANSLKVVIYQKLIKRRCEHCLESTLGCSHCNYTGFKGRIAIGELLYIDEELKQSIINDEFENKINEYIKNKKFIKIDKNIKKAEKENLIKI